MRTAALVLAIPLLVGLTACSSSSKTSAAASAAKASTTTSGSSGGASSGPSTKGCPKASVVDATVGSTFSGPTTGVAGGTAPCVYTTSGDATEVNVLFNAPGLAQGAFATQAKSDMGPTAASVSGVGKAAFASTAYGHGEIEVWESPSKSFSITIDHKDATVHSTDAADIKALAQKMVG